MFMGNIIGWDIYFVCKKFTFICCLECISFFLKSTDYHILDELFSYLHCHFLVRLCVCVYKFNCSTNTYILGIILDIVSLHSAVSEFISRSYQIFYDSYSEYSLSTSAVALWSEPPSPLAAADCPHFWLPLVLLPTACCPLGGLSASLFKSVYLLTASLRVNAKSLQQKLTLSPP